MLIRSGPIDTESFCEGVFSLSLGTVFIDARFFQTHFVATLVLSFPSLAIESDPLNYALVVVLRDSYD